MTRSAAVVFALIALVAGVAGALVGSPWDNDGQQVDTNTIVNGAAGAGGATPTTTAESTLSIVATATVTSVPVFGGVNGAELTRLANPIESGAPLTFLVRQREGDWLRVLLPLRPNGSEGYIRVADVTLTSHRFKILVQLAAHRLIVTNGAEKVIDTPVGIGKRDTPTPGGLYYTKELLQPPDPNGPYGHYAYGLSGFSNVLTSFAGGDGVVGIHGTNDPGSIGKDSSHGCLRVSNEIIDKLAGMLPLGVPVQIVA